jgi:hypothetical protein
MPKGKRRGLLRLAGTLAICLLILATVLMSSSAKGPRTTKSAQTKERRPTASHRPTTAVQTPARLSAAGSSHCSVTVASTAAAGDAVRHTTAGGVVCVAAGTYPGLDLAGAHRRTVTVQPVPGQKVTIAAGVIDSHRDRVAALFEPGASHIILHGFYITDEVELEPGGAFIRIDHNDITGGWFGIQLDSSDCTVPNSPSWSGCRPLPKIANVTISGNRIHDIVHRDDSLNLDNFSRVRITGNEMFHIIEGGDHTDCLQTTFGGRGLVFDHNYEHDNNCQGFFTKDGDITDAIIYDNLFLRDQVAHWPMGNIDIVNVYRLILRNNTSWPDTTDTLRDFSSAHQAQAAVDHNVFEAFSNGCCNDSSHFVLHESLNIFGRAPYTFTHALTDRVARRPRFIDPARDDYRLSRNPHRIGVDWSPTDRHYGP